jgi:membrane protein
MTDDSTPGGVRALPGQLRSRFESSFAVRAFDRFSAIDGKTRGLVIAGQAFTSLIPLFILVASFGDHDSKSSGLADSLILRFHLSGSAATAVRDLFTRPPGATGTLGVVSLVILLFSLLSLTRALQGVFESAWGFKPQGFRGTLNGLSGTTLFVTEAIVLTILAAALRGAPAATLLNAIIRLGAAFVLWLALQNLLLSRRVPWRELRRAALVATIGQAVFSFGSALYMPHLIAKDASNYGIIGVTLALITWLIALSVGIVIIAVVGAELAGVPKLDTLEAGITADGTPADTGGA